MIHAGSGGKYRLWVTCGGGILQGGHLQHGIKIIPGQHNGLGIKLKSALNHEFCLNSLRWGRMMHRCVGNIIIIGTENGLSPGRCQAIIWTNDGILLIGPLPNKLQCNHNQNSYIFIQENTFENVVCKMSTILSRPQWQCVEINLMRSYWTFKMRTLNQENIIYWQQKNME